MTFQYPVNVRRISLLAKLKLAACVKLICACFLLLNVQLNVANANTVSLVGNKVATYIDEHELPARQMDLVRAALADLPEELKLTATTQAWKGSGLKSGKFIGYYDHYSLNDVKDDYVYSAPYMKVNLHIVSRYQRAENIIRLEQMYRERVGIENRFANTDVLRAERDVSWARAPSFFDVIKQLAEDRVDFLLVDKRMIDEMNILLASVGEKPVYISKQAIVQVDVSLAMQKANAQANKIISTFETGISSLRSNGEYDKLMQINLQRDSLLDDRIYTDMLRKW